MKNKLTSIAVRNAKPGRLFDGGGLFLIKKEAGGNWIWRYTHLKQTREMGLGTLDAVGLADARKARDTWAGVLASGVDPISERNRLRDAEKAAQDKEAPTFADIAELVFESHKAGLRGDGDRGKWFSPLRVHVIPKLGQRRISEIHQSDIATCLRPIWKTKHPTAVKAWQRTRFIFQQAELMGYDCRPFVADAARVMLGKVDHQTENVTSTPWQEVPALYGKLAGMSSPKLCLRWMILTCVREAGCLGARFDEIEDGIWTVPADRIKGMRGKVQPFRVPLGDEALEIIETARKVNETYLFPSYRKRGGHITEAALRKELAAQGEAGRPHGFRSSFRTWAEDTDQPWDVAETILGHQIKGRVERAYARSDLLDRRRIVMDKWAAHVTQSSADVIKLRG
ncbi:integrase arm-type DNA-binding domain-containing protein [uncultured Sulfitobacter sp.]|uniref:tyrosine-type recombinase/integrase n=1 Tax=uncultured Sulfitobacter sp. TaxID=191468 RepID=UPI0030D798E0